MIFADETVAAVARGLAASGYQTRPEDHGKSAVGYTGLSEHFREGAWKRLRDDGNLPPATNRLRERIKAITARHGGMDQYFLRQGPQAAH